jgi:hypothetical protein
MNGDFTFVPCREALTRNNNSRRSSNNDLNIPHLRDAIYLNVTPPPQCAYRDAQYRLIVLLSEKRKTRLLLWATPNFPMYIGAHRRTHLQHLTF